MEVLFTQEWYSWINKNDWADSDFQLWRHTNLEDRHLYYNAE